ncbi:MAG: ATP-binding cassette domain-containing protein [Chloroflexi bacterium]|nr:ATP-binding cassette domain-containing protein [Chloroflexota bacterium]
MPPTLKTLDLEHVNKSFGGVIALQNISFSIEGGLVAGIVGPNNSGKTVLLDCINGVHTIDKGRIFFNGQNIAHQAPARCANNGITRMFQFPKLFLSLTVDEHLTISRHRRFGNLLDTFWDRRAWKEQSVQTLQRLQLWDKKDVYIQDLTIDDQKKLELAMATVSQPQLILIDEISTGAMQQTVDFMLEYLLEIKQLYDPMILIVEHNLSIIRMICNRVLVMNSGLIVAEGTPNEVLTDDLLLKTFFTL